MNGMCKSRAAIRALGCSYDQLTGLLRRGRIPEPAKDESGDFWWSEADLERARQALAAGRRRANADRETATS
jgi:hypothetical protein